MTFLRPDLWWPAAVALVALAVLFRLRRRRVLTITTLSLLASPYYRASRFRRLPFALVSIALALALIGLLEPAIRLGERRVEARGLDIVLVIDLSLSMSQPIGFKDAPGAQLPQTEAGGQRIDAIKEALRDFISRRPDDRIGVVVFSDHAYVVSPLTFDKAHLVGYFDLIDPKTLQGEGMTAIGEGISMASFLLDRQSTAGARNKAIIVFTDGASNLGRDPVEALDDAAAVGVHVHVVGVDIEEEEKRHPEVGHFIAAVRQNGGRYFAADSRTELDAASRELDRTEKNSLTMKVYVRNEPIVQWFALPALMALLIAAMLRAVPTFIGLH